MITSTARKHVAHAIVKALRIDLSEAREIIAHGRNETHLRHAGPLRDAFVTVDGHVPMIDSGKLTIYVRGRIATTIVAPAGSLHKWARLPMEEAYPQIPGHAENDDANIPMASIRGTIMNVRDHHSVDGALYLDVDVHVGATQVLTLLPMPWHEGDMLLTYAKEHLGREMTFHHCPAIDATGCMHGMRHGLREDEKVCEFILPADHAVGRLAV